MNQKIEIKELTSLRFLAAMHVVLFHNMNMLGTDITKLPNWLLAIISYGYCGVTFFFVLSGFILAYVYSDSMMKSETSSAQFYYARFSRIYPIYFLALIVDLPRGMAYFIENHSPLKMAASSVAYLVMLQSWHPRLATIWNSPAWSLSTEAFFYLIFPFVLPHIMKTRKNIIWIILFYMVPLIIYYLITSIFRFNLEAGIHEVFWRSFPLIRMFEFLIGIYLGKLFLHDHKVVQAIRKNTYLSGIIFWVLAGGSLMLITQESFIPQSLFPNLILLPVFSLMILILISVKVPLAFMLRNKAMLILGSSSYALYILHVPMKPYIERINDLIPLSFTGSPLFIYLILMVVISLVVYYYIEIPAQKILRQKIFSPRK
ncbi:MAG: acyltransferase [Bacteriovorax sp.]|nr:acyltransferase [Bacteriovorax sp.]